MITPQEEAILNMLGAAFNAFIKLPEEHPNATAEFCVAIHRCQDMVAARPAYRHINRGK